MPHRCKHTSGRTREYNIEWRQDRPPILVKSEDWVDWVADGTCEFGNCLEFVCPVCGCNKYGGMGPIECPCDDTVPNHEERIKPKVAVKPSLRTNGARRRRRR